VQYLASLSAAAHVRLEHISPDPTARISNPSISRMNDARGGHARPDRSRFCPAKMRSRWPEKNCERSARLGSGRTRTHISQLGLESPGLVGVVTSPSTSARHVPMCAVCTYTSLFPQDWSLFQHALLSRILLTFCLDAQN
jgi:hypothetical protein